MNYPLAATATSLATRLADLWQAEEHIGYRLDAWLLRHARNAEMPSSRDASIVRRDYHRARQQLSQHLRALGRDVVRLPMIAPEGMPADGTGEAARGLQRLFHDLTRANHRLNRLSRIAILQRDRTSARVLSALHESQMDTIELVRELFQQGQEASRAAIGGQAA